MSSADVLRERLSAEGFVTVSAFLDAAWLETLRGAVVGIESAGVRNLIAKVPAVRAWAASVAVRELIESVLGCDSRLVRSIFFTKDGERNWHVGWHQDVMIAVAERRELAGFGAWSVKEGVPHVQAPTAVLEKMVTLRVHLDAADADNGALCVAPGSHRLGSIGAESAVLEQCGMQVCAVSAGDALLMRPLLLHASRKSISPRPRRVVHLEFAAADALPAPLEWAESA